MSKATLDVDKILESLKPDTGIPGTLTTSFFYKNVPVTLRIDPEETIEDALQAARNVLLRLTDLEQAARGIAARDLLKTYNENWRSYYEMQEDGSYIDVENPPLNSSQFQAAMSLTALCVTGPPDLTFYYCDGDMFAGHSIVVTAPGGADFTDAYAEIMG